MNTFRFTWDGIIYEFNANECYNNGELIELPDGTILKVGWWAESMPPQPNSLTTVNYLKGMEPTIPVKAKVVGHMIPIFPPGK